MSVGYNGLNKPKTVRLPESLVGAFIDNEDSIYNFKTDELLLKRDVVDVKEDAPSVGRNYSYSRSRSSYSSRSRSSYSSRKSKKTKKGKKTRSKSVTIKNGDTLSEIAARNHTTVKKLRKLNGISGSTIRAGKKIKVK